MPFKYHPPTRTKCEICEKLSQEDIIPPIIDTHNGKASSANNFPFHNWYNFVLGYSPEFPEYMLNREKITNNQFVVDPFMGSGTTLIACKAKGIPSCGIDANDFMVDAARVKINWDIDLQLLRLNATNLIDLIHHEMEKYRWDTLATTNQLSLFGNNGYKSYLTLLEDNRPEMLQTKYISDQPLAKAIIIDQIISNQFQTSPFRQIFDLALTSIIVPISNVRYGPGFGIVKPRDDFDVASMYTDKLNRMVEDLSQIQDNLKSVPSKVFLGDARNLQDFLEPDSIDLMITSPPYPGDHEYTKHTRLELIFRGYAQTIEEFRQIKKRMLRASTTNIYKDDNDKADIVDLQSIQLVTDLIEARLENDGATSGFEKLYTKLVWEYFGGMHKVLEQSFKVLKPGGKIGLLVSDSHAFKMVHIQTADILQEIGVRAGFLDSEIVLWQLKSSTSHKYFLRENILILQKPY